MLKKKVELIKLQYDEKKEIYSIFPNKKVSGIITIGNFSETSIKKTERDLFPFSLILKYLYF